MNSGMNSTKAVSKKETIPQDPKKSLFDLLGSVTAETENVEELHFLMVKIHQTVRNSIEKIESKNSVLVLEDESTLKKF